MSDLKDQLERALAEGIELIGSATDGTSLEDAQIRVLGRKASLARARGALRDVAPEDRKELGRLANEVQGELERALAVKREQFAESERADRWERERIDVTLPAEDVPIANLHPLTKTMWELVDIFVGLGYKVAEGPEVELSTYIFDALNMSQAHPTRSPQQTFFIQCRGSDVVLRSETSPVQIRTMESQDPPVYVVVPGRVYRRDTQDATHLSGFTQMEGLATRASPWRTSREHSRSSRARSSGRTSRFG
jgi:phenylalanyl-tRNA synthetase alpha chain